MEDFNFYRKFGIFNSHLRKQFGEAFLDFCLMVLKEVYFRFYIRDVKLEMEVWELKIRFILIYSLYIGINCALSLRFTIENFKDVSISSKLFLFFFFQNYQRII